MGKFKCLDMELLSASYQLSVVHIPGYNYVNPIENNKKNTLGTAFYFYE